jgi:DNA-directed RNA polymerase I, II, and III subunit RPABC2
MSDDEDYYESDANESSSDDESENEEIKPSMPLSGIANKNILSDDEDDDEDSIAAGGGGKSDDEYDDDAYSDNDDDEAKPQPNAGEEQQPQQVYEEDDDDEDERGEKYLQKFDVDINKNYINDFHPECLVHNFDEVAKLALVVRDADGIIIDPLHKTIPYLTKYEKAKILGQRTKQIEMGSKPFIKIDDNIIDCYIIAELELQVKKIPFIIKRPIPGGAFEYWHVRDLENIAF